MPSGDEYRVKASELLAKSRQESDPLLRAEFQSLAQGYLLLAEHAERNAAGYDPLAGPPAQTPPHGEPTS
jgi:hypothetical protein